MLRSGDWLNPMRNGHTGHWTKPPLTYWLVGASVATFGHNPWAARDKVFELGYVAQPLGTHYQGRIIFEVLAPDGRETTPDIGG